MTGLKDKRVGVAADRRADSISTLIENMGGVPSVFPIQGKQRLDTMTCEQNVADYLREDFDWVILTTGIGARTLADSAHEQGVYGPLINKLAVEPLAIRGSKTMDWLKENELEPHIVSEDGTMNALLERLSNHHIGQQGRVFLQAYNQDDAKLKHALEDIGYSVYLSKPYSFESPSADVLNELKQSILLSKLDTVVFTSKTQVKNLFNEEEDHQALTDAFNREVLAVAVGKVTAKELENQGIEQVLQPERPKMGSMVVTLDRHYR